MQCELVNFYVSTCFFDTLGPLRTGAAHSAGSPFVWEIHPHAKDGCAKRSALKFVRLLLESLLDTQVCEMCGR